jgi:hypothetical protein
LINGRVKRLKKMGITPAPYPNEEPRMKKTKKGNLRELAKIL